MPITKKTKMGDVIKDFQKSDASQFRGKSKEKRRQMAIAAKLSKMDEKISPLEMIKKHKKKAALKKKIERLGKIANSAYNKDKEDVGKRAMTLQRKYIKKSMKETTMNTKKIAEAMKTYRSKSGGVVHDTGWYTKKGPRKDRYGNVIKDKNRAKHLAKLGAREAEKMKEDVEIQEAIPGRVVAKHPITGKTKRFRPGDAKSIAAWKSTRPAVKSSAKRVSSVRKKLQTELKKLEKEVKSLSKEQNDYLNNWKRMGLESQEQGYAAAEELQPQLDRLYNQMSKIENRMMMYVGESVEISEGKLPKAGDSYRGGRVKHVKPSWQHDDEHVHTATVDHGMGHGGKRDVRRYHIHAKTGKEVSEAVDKKPSAAAMKNLDALYKKRAMTGGHGKRAKITAMIDAHKAKHGIKESQLDELKKSTYHKYMKKTLDAYQVRNEKRSKCSAEGEKGIKESQLD
jgi:hypothetical protein